MIEFTAELVGTAILLLLGNGVVANCILKQTKGKTEDPWLLISVGWGMAVFVAVLITMDYSGAHLNPAVTIGLAAAGKFAWSSVPLYIAAQMLGAAIGAGLVWLMYQDHYNATEDPGTKFGTFATAPAIRNNVRNLISEAIGTFVLIFAVLYITGPNLVAADAAKPVGLGSLGALPVGLVVLAIGMSLGGTTGYAINPARDLAPRIMHAILPIKDKGSSGWDYAWIPIAGPILGALMAVGLSLLVGS